MKSHLITYFFSNEVTGTVKHVQDFHAPTLRQCHTFTSFLTVHGYNNTLITDDDQTVTATKVFSEVFFVVVVTSEHTLKHRSFAVAYCRCVANVVDMSLYCVSYHVIQSKHHTKSLGPSPSSSFIQGTNDWHHLSAVFRNQNIQGFLEILN